MLVQVKVTIIETAWRANILCDSSIMFSDVAYMWTGATEPSVASVLLRKLPPEFRNRYVNQALVLSCVQISHCAEAKFDLRVGDFVRFLFAGSDNFSWYILVSHSLNFADCFLQCF